MKDARILLATLFRLLALTPPVAWARQGWYPRSGARCRNTHPRGVQSKAVTLTW
jgi:hypothetical protein